MKKSNLNWTIGGIAFGFLQRIPTNHQTVQLQGFFGWGIKMKLLEQNNDINKK